MVLVYLFAIRVFHSVILLHAAKTLVDLIEWPHVKIFEATFELAVIAAKKIHADAANS